ncbi:MAG: hypothetical protein HQK49_00525 [Oligoflexia bacterium]|nr:hypothetical protein [Oligoflexia bacterium]
MMNVKSTFLKRILVMSIVVLTGVSIYSFPASAFAAAVSDDKQIFLFNSKENCSLPELQAKEAQIAAEMSCKWIEENGAGDRQDPKSAFGKIFRYRFCKDNYVAVLDYVKMDATSHDPYKLIILHPTKPGLEGDMHLAHKSFTGGYHVLDLHYYGVDLDPAGCWIGYLWTKPGSESASEKLTFVKKCKDKLTGKYMIVNSGVHAELSLLDKLNSPTCKKANNVKEPFKK